MCAAFIRTRRCAPAATRPLAARAALVALPAASRAPCLSTARAAAGWRQDSSILRGGAARLAPRSGTTAHH